MKAKKLLALLLAAVMVLSMVACGGDSSTDSTSGNSNIPNSGDSTVTAEIPEYMNMDSQMPIVKEGTDITLEVMVVNGPMYSNLSSIRDVYFVDAYEKKTGVKI